MGCKCLAVPLVPPPQASAQRDGSRSGEEAEPGCAPAPPCRVFAEPVSPIPQMKVTVSRGGDHNSDGDSVREATSSRRSSSRDQLSDVSSPAAHRSISGSLGRLPDQPPTFRHCKPFA